LGVSGYTWPSNDVGSGPLKGPAVGRQTVRTCKSATTVLPVMGSTEPSGYLGAEFSSQGRCMEGVFPNTSMLR
jgi:hypothetical protein